MIWIHFEQHSRWHAVLYSGEGFHVTYCGRYAPADLEQCSEPRARCACCKVRIARPYLMPIELRQKLQKARTAS